MTIRLLATGGLLGAALCLSGCSLSTQGQVDLPPASIATSAPTSAPASGSAVTVPKLTATAPPTPAAVLAAAVWSNTDCTWALGTMEEDLSLDQASATEVANGTDPQHYPASYAAQYRAWVTAWTAVVSQVQTICSATPILPTWAETTGAQADFQTAITSHQIDETNNPQNTSWDNTWIANYQRMISLYGLIPCPAGESSSQDAQCSAS